MNKEELKDKYNRKLKDYRNYLNFLKRNYDNYIISKEFIKSYNKLESKLKDLQNE